MRTATILAALLASSLFEASSWGADVALNELMADLQKQRFDKSQFLLAWWMPVEYWQASLRAQGGLSEDQMAKVTNAVDDYFVLCVVDTQISTFGAIEPKPRSEVLKEVAIKIDSGVWLQPLSDEAISADAKNLFAMIRPVMGNMLGQFGQGVEFVIFPGKDPQGRRIADPHQAGGFTVRLGEVSFHWRLPLGSLLPPKYDAQTGEKFPGNYRFSPYTGQELVNERPRANLETQK